MRFRQINLDFHTGEHIPDVGMKFDKKQFQECLKLGHINSITLFSKCHHGWAYHPTEKNEMHPNLNFDLLGAQIEAAHEIGVSTPIYFSGGVDEKMADRMPQWRLIGFGGDYPDYSVPRYHCLCFNTDYTDYLCEQIEEALSKYDADGVFVDISFPRACGCNKCLSDMKKLGMNPDSLEDAWKLGNIVYDKFVKKVRASVDKVKPGLPIYHNSGHIYKGRRDISYGNSHLEIEDLPTGIYGYDYFPISASYARTIGMDYLGMTGKFHLAWGEFGGFKHFNALRYEVSVMAANGAKFSIGDQLHPSGMMDKVTYELIGKAYAEAEQKEPWLDGAENIADIGVLGVEAINNYYHPFDINPQLVNDTDSGCVRILNEGHYLYNFIDAEEDFSRYKLIILPDKVELDQVLEQKLRTAVSKGTKILASGRSGLIDGKIAFDLGCEFVGESEFNPTYIHPTSGTKTYDETAFVIYSTGYKVRLTGEELATVENPYFNRTLEHFCSHMHAPSCEKVAGSGITAGKDGMYIAWDMFSEYCKTGSLVSKEIVFMAIDRLLDKTVETNLPQQGMMTYTKQGERRIVHLIYGSTVRRGAVDVIEDLIPVCNTEVKVKCDIKPGRVYLAPQNKEIPFTEENGYICFKIDEFECHQMVVIEK